MLKKLALFFAPVILFLLVFGLIRTSAAGSNLIANPSVETASGSLPLGWNQGKWGTNTTTFTYQTTGAHTGSRDLYVNMTKHTSGDAKWYFTDVPVKPNTSYTYSEFYKSNVATEVDIQYTSTSNQLSYVYLSSPAASATNWAASTATFTTPANVKSLTIFHVINKVGWLQTDDFSLVDNTASAPTPPSINFTSPAAGATVSGIQSVTANATDAIGVAGVQFKVDNTNIGAEDTTAPYSASLDTTTLANGSHTLTATVRNTSGLTTTASETINIQNTVVQPTPPTVNLTAPAAGKVSGTQAVSASAADAIGVKSVQFMLDGVNLGSADTASPYSINWDTTKVTNGSHTLTAVATNTSNMTATSSPVAVDVENLVAPVVQITAPTASVTVSGSTVSFTANASSSQGITSVQFKLNGTNVGSPITAAPYTMVWDSTKTSNGNYSLTAIATDKANLTTTSAAVTFSVLNQTSGGGSTGTNLIANPSFETSANGTAPDSWLSSNWGNNTSKFTYLTSGHTGSRSVEVQTTAWTNGAANWYYNDVAVTAGKTYQYTNWYKSNVDTEVDAEVLMSNGTTSYYYLGTVLSSPSAWTKFTTTFTVPAGAKSLAIYQILAKVGYIISDDYSLTAYTPAAFTRPLVSVTFDDGWANQYQNAYPLLKQYGIPATFYIISGELNDQPDYMSGTQIKTLQGAGNEIASHSVTHPDLTTLSATKLQQEIANSQTTLQNLLGVPVTDFAYPFGAYNSNTIAVGQQYYQSQRTVNAGENTKDNFNITQLKIQEVDSNITVAQVQGWINAAIADKAWLILVYHETANSPVDPSDAQYTTKPADLSSELAYLKQTGVATVTVQQALNEILPQL